ncbi:MAG: methylated-DNA--[protein]-cysteine S-methyltransferase [Synergistaceae bacterium]|nr:methylated-DNA--[protein]-cysteine S-methyltransferase [Synergistaceae bacterium]
MKNFAKCYFDIVGMLTIGEEDGKLTDLHFETSGTYPRGDLNMNETPLLAETSRQLGEYFEGKRKCFELPLAPKGTPFQMRCWEALQKIPYCSTVTYGDIARAVGSPKGFRAVGLANNRNPIAIIIPCHRVIGVNGKLVGFGGGLDMKSNLLLHEAQYVNRRL